MKKYECIFAEGVTLEQVNPDNHAMKTPYIDSLMTICLAVLPVVGQMVSGIKMINGFYSRSKLFNEVLGEKDSASKEQLAHTKGLALEFSWEGYDPTNALVVARKLFDNIEDNMHIIVSDVSVGVYRHMRDKRVIRLTGNSRNTVYS